MAQRLTKTAADGIYVKYDSRPFLIGSQPMSRVAPGPNPSTPQSELAAALQACRNALIGVGIFSAVSNILMLTGSIFMLEVYDRVLPSKSVPTLIGLCVIAAFLFGMLGIIDLIRSRLMVRIGTSLDEALSKRVYE